jgi:hypothetical protein
MRTLSVRDADRAVRSVAVVDVAQESARAGAQSGLAGTLAELGYDVTLVRPEARRRGAGLTGSGKIHSLIAPRPCIDVHPRFLSLSYQLYLALRATTFDAIVFEDRGGHGYCTARARQVGLGFANTSVVVACSGGALYDAARDSRLYLSKGELATGVLERLALGLADVAIFDDDAQIEWLDAAGWVVPSSRVVGSVDWSDAASWAEMRRPEGQGSQASGVDVLPPVSIVVPRYERTSFLPQCLDGLVTQSHLPAEVIVADDGSSSSAAIRQLEELESRSWPWPLRILRLPHGGVSAARNAGWRAATSALVAFVDDDDVLFPEALEVLARSCLLSGADVVTSGSRSFSGDAAPRARDGDVIGLHLGEPYELGLLTNYYGGVTSLWSRPLLEQLGGFRGGTLVEDWELLARAALSGARVVSVPDAVFWYRLTPQGRYSADPLANRPKDLIALAEAHASQLPAQLRLLPLLAVGAYEELERQRVAAQPWRRRSAARARLLLERARDVTTEEGASAAIKRTLRYVGGKS